MYIVLHYPHAAHFKDMKIRNKYFENGLIFFFCIKACEENITRPFKTFFFESPGLLKIVYFSDSISCKIKSKL